MGLLLHPLARRVGRRRRRRHGARLAHVGEVALVGLDEAVDALAVSVVRLAADVRGVARGGVAVVDLAPGGWVHVAQRGQVDVVRGRAVVGRQGRRRRGRRRRGRRRRGRRRGRPRRRRPRRRAGARRWRRARRRARGRSRRWWLGEGARLLELAAVRGRRRVLCRARALGLPDASPARPNLPLYAV